MDRPRRLEAFLRSHRFRVHQVSHRYLPFCPDHLQYLVAGPALGAREPAPNERESHSRHSRKRLLQHLDSGVCPIYVRRLPPCRNACPSSEDIRGHLTRIAQTQLRGQELEDSLDEAWHLITDKNPFPAVIGRICPHPCENACNRKRIDWPVAIHSMERFIGDRGLERGLETAPPGRTPDPRGGGWR